ncbi:MAG TPA: anaerobic ribonucleoside-triphosphate reductase, partial [Clostridia bacterium]|nr:anaerobic ribonucleoside-triphosphate reductase [Clostridia bacterium]
IGINEAALNAKWLRANLTEPKAQQFAKELLNHMRERLSDYQEQYGDLYNLEATPAESTTYRLAKHDVKKFPDIITANEKDGAPYYTNSSHLPVGYTDDIFSALDIQDGLQTLYTSGTVFHTFIGEKLPDWKAAARLVKVIAENYKVPYYTISPTYSVCQTHGYMPGEIHNCPDCGNKNEVYSRITGYYRPVQNWNEGKTQEFKERKLYDVAAVALKKEQDSEKEQGKTPSKQVLLFTTKSCPNCKTVKSILDTHNVSYDIIDANENSDLAKQFNIRLAPTLVVIEGDNAESFINTAKIREYAEGQV